MNKPVAWMDKETGCFVYSQYDYEDLDEHGKDGLIPLYTHPLKELTDEEIEECFEESCTDFKLLENGKTKGIVNIIDVGRTILRKAREK